MTSSEFDRLDKDKSGDLDAKDLTQSSLRVSHPNFGELTNSDVYVKTRQQEFNYPQGESNNLTSYEGNGGIALGGFLRRMVIAFDQSDLAKLPFSDDVNKDSRLLMRRNIRDRVSALAPFLTYDPDAYIVLDDNGGPFWRSGLVADCRGTPGGTGPKRTSIRRVAPIRSGPQRARRRSRQRPCRLPASDSGRQARRGWKET